MLISTHQTCISRSIAEKKPTDYSDSSTFFPFSSSFPLLALLAFLSSLLLTFSALLFLLSTPPASAASTGTTFDTTSPSTSTFPFSPSTPASAHPPSPVPSLTISPVPASPFVSTSPPPASAAAAGAISGGGGGTYTPASACCTRSKFVITISFWFGLRLASVRKADRKDSADEGRSGVLS
ncbi:hypothetical protein HOY80DRAFT_999597 [Tuber brumale]|nr:hypothetical protein HOY80DRAFT_999597 [Tuber brumale]